MRGQLAIGVGCRRGSSAKAIEAVLRRALDGMTDPVRTGIFTIEDKADEAGLIEAARRLDLPLFFVTRDTLLAQVPRTRSERVRRRFGVPSVAEAAALAGAGAHAVLIGPRIADLGVTCAIARGGDPTV